MLQQRADLTARLADLKPQATKAQREVSKLELTLQQLNRRIEMAKRVSEPRVSDHAVIRFLEREHGFSFEDIRAQILTPDRIAAIKAGCTAIKHRGTTFIVRDEVIVTVLD